MLNGIDNQEVKKIDAVAHATDVGYDPIPKIAEQMCPRNAAR